MADMIADIQRYWNTRIHDLEMTDREVGTLAFFDDLDEYRFDKLHYLPQLVDFEGFRGETLLEVGCGIGTDLVRFAKGGARVTGVEHAIEVLTPAELDRFLQLLDQDHVVGDRAVVWRRRGTRRGWVALRARRRLRQQQRQRHPGDAAGTGDDPPPSGRSRRRLPASNISHDRSRHQASRNCPTV